MSSLSALLFISGKHSKVITTFEKSIAGAFDFSFYLYLDTYTVYLYAIIIIIKMSFQSKIVLQLLELQAYSQATRCSNVRFEYEILTFRAKMTIAGLHICACRTRIADQPWSVRRLIRSRRSRRAKQAEESSVAFSRILISAFGYFLLTEDVRVAECEKEREGSFFVCIAHRGSHCRYTRPLNNGTIIPIVTGVTQELRRL